MSVAAFLAILAVHLMAVVSPGPSFLLTVRTAVAEGFGPVLLLSLGFGVGAVIWGIAALLGLHLLFEVAPFALWALKVAGALFLLWIAVQTWRHAAEPLPDLERSEAPPRSGLSAFRLGLLTQLANPKPAIFFGAIFVGLVPVGTPTPVLALLLAVMLVNETLWYLLVGRLFSLAQARRAYAGFKAWVDRLFGALLAALALGIVVAR
jgi:threonine/homoserine/homoserine lactone efflux protein